MASQRPLINCLLLHRPVSVCLSRQARVFKQMAQIQPGWRWHEQPEQRRKRSSQEENSHRCLLSASLSELDFAATVTPIMPPIFGRNGHLRFPAPAFSTNLDHSNKILFSGAPHVGTTTTRLTRETPLLQRRQLQESGMREFFFKKNQKSIM